MSGYFSFPLLSYSLRSRTRSFIVWSIITLCIFIFIIVMFTNMLDAGLPDFINDMLSSIPSSVTGSSDSSVSLPDFTDFSVNFGACMQIMLIVGCIYACSLGASANSNSHGDSDITFIYAQPVSRLATVLSSYAAQLVTLFCYDVVVYIVAFAMLYANNRLSYMGVLTLAMLAYFFMEAVYLSITFLFSTFMSSGTQAASVAALTITATLLFGLLGVLASSLSFFKYLSPYTYVSVYSIITGGGSSYFAGIVVGFVIIIAAVVVSCIRYEKIDFLLE